MPRCRNCRKKFEAVHFNQKYCFESACAKVWYQKAKEENRKKLHKKWKQELKSTRDYLKEAQVWFNKYVRMRDACMPCISCNKVMTDKYDAGHYYSAGGHSILRFHEDNVHSQCVHCNQYLSGNLLNYQEGLVNRIGKERVLDLSKIANNEKRWEKTELQSIIKEYKEKCKYLMHK